MGRESQIEWTDYSASPWYRVSGSNGTRVISRSFHHSCRRWNGQAEKDGVRQSVFLSICDPFEKWDGPMLVTNGDHYDPTVSSKTMDDCRTDLFATIDACPWLDFLLLTKRPENVRRMWTDAPCLPCIQEGEICEARVMFRQNVYLLASISDQATADGMIPALLECRNLVPVLGLSIEPLLGPVDLAAIGRNSDGWPAVNALTGERRADQGPTTRVHDGPRIDWVIVGGESGLHRRPMNPEWGISIVNQCRAASVPCFVKQIQINGKVCHEIERFPAELQVREFPIVARADC